MQNDAPARAPRWQDSAASLRGSSWRWPWRHQPAGFCSSAIPTRIDVSRPTVVQQIQQLQRLETVVYSMEKIVTGSQESKYLPRMLAGERLLLIVHGDVTAGVDLGALDPSQLTIDGKTVSIKLPEPSVFSTRLDNQRTRVYSRETGLFTTPDPDLESDVRREAERANDPGRPRWRHPENRRHKRAHDADQPAAGIWVSKR